MFNGPQARRRQAADDAADQLDAADGRRAGGLVYTGKTIIRLNSGGNMTVTNYTWSTAAATQTRALAGQRRPLRQEQRRVHCGTIQPPSTPTTTSRPRCGNVYVSGTYSKSLTIAAANDMIIAPTERPLAAVTSTNPSPAAPATPTDRQRQLGLIANNFVASHNVVRAFHHVQLRQSIAD